VRPFIVTVLPVMVEPPAPALVTVGFSFDQPCTKRPAPPMSVGISGAEV
jgi:hypothetical protein